MSRHQQRRDFWERQIAEWSQSDQPASAWCAERDLSRRHMQRLDDGSRMNREVHVRFCEGPMVQFLRSTH
ncbi:MAG: IS66 family insertion sequence element accessory protein TnpA, partial [Phycisphaerae bacterium]